MEGFFHGSGVGPSGDCDSYSYSEQIFATMTTYIRHQTQILGDQGSSEEYNHCIRRNAHTQILFGYPTS